MLHLSDLNSKGFRKGHSGTNYISLEDLSSLLAGDFLWGVGFWKAWLRAAENLLGVGLCLEAAVSTSEHADWISEMSKSGVVLPLTAGPAAGCCRPGSPGRLGVLLGSEERGHRQVILPSSPHCHRSTKLNTTFNLSWSAGSQEVLRQHLWGLWPYATLRG